jgi:hypothetical protein
LEVFVSSGGALVALRTLPYNDTNSLSGISRELRITLGRIPQNIRERICQARLIGASGLDWSDMLGELGLEIVLAKAESLPPPSARLEFFHPPVSRWPLLLERVKTHRHAAAIAAVVVLLPILLFTARSFWEGRLESRWRSMEKKVAELEDLQKKIRQYRPWSNPVPEKMRALRTLVETFPAEGDLWVRTIKISPQNNKTPGATSTEGFTLNLTGFARSQEHIIHLQETLSKRPGVSDVHLKQYQGAPLQFTLSFTYLPQP